MNCITLSMKNSWSMQKTIGGYPFSHTSDSFTQAFGKNAVFLENDHHGSTADLTIIIPFSGPFRFVRSQQRKRLAACGTHHFVHIHLPTIAAHSKKRNSVIDINMQKMQNVTVDMEFTSTLERIIAMKSTLLLTIVTLPFIAASCRKEAPATPAPAAPSTPAAPAAETAPASTTETAPAADTAAAPAADAEAVAKAAADAEAAAKAAAEAAAKAAAEAAAQPAAGQPEGGQ
jgi:hypothetical protein